MEGMARDEEKEVEGNGGRDGGCRLHTCGISSLTPKELASISSNLCLIKDNIMTTKILGLRGRGRGRGDER